MFYKYYEGDLYNEFSPIRSQKFEIPHLLLILVWLSVIILLFFIFLTEDYIIENFYVYDNMILQTLFTEAMEIIEKMYPNLF